MTDIETMLMAYLEEMDGRPVTWGIDDCSAWPAEWIRRATGHTIKLPRYSNRDEAHALIERSGSLHALWSDHLADAGFAETTEPRLGDVGVVDISQGQVGVVFGHAGLAFWRAEGNGAGGVRPFQPRTRYIAGIWSICG